MVCSVEKSKGSNVFLPHRKSRQGGSPTHEDPARYEEFQTTTEMDTCENCTRIVGNRKGKYISGDSSRSPFIVWSSVGYHECLGRAVIKLLDSGAHFAGIIDKAFHLFNNKSANVMTSKNTSGFTSFFSSLLGPINISENDRKTAALSFEFAVC